ncbi:MAG TPA: hypothetical protein VMR52_11065 [Dehalococcoidia bacterium]|nr:hypothetical protein [Dehalococcoidia bacterium]
MGTPAARVGDQVAHSPPGVLSGASGSPNVSIGGKAAWRGVPQGAVPLVSSARQAADAAIQSAEMATQAAAGRPEYGATKSAELTVKQNAATSNASVVRDSAGGADIHQCSTLLPRPGPAPGPGICADVSTTVLINGAPAARQGDTILEAVGPPNKITGGCQSVQVGP